MKKFIFSTKFLGDKSEYVFSNRNTLSDDASILKLIKKDKDYFTDLVKEKFADSEFLKKITSELNENISDIDIKDFQSDDRFKKAFIHHTSELPRFSYYTCDDNNNPECSVFAVPCWKEPSVEWINALINDESVGTLGKGDTLYLILHDKDVPGCSGKTFEILTPEKIEIIQKSFGDIVGEKRVAPTKEAKWMQNSFEIKIIVFNHVGNAIVDILINKNNATKTSANIARQIESIFENKILIDSLFDPKIQDPLGVFLKLDVNGFVDLCNNQIDTVQINKNEHQIKVDKQLLSSERKYYYTYDDSNGALLTELLHVKADIRSSEQFKDLIEKLRTPAYTKLTKEISISKIKDMMFPIIIKIRDFFGEWENAVEDKIIKEQIRSHRNNEALKQNLEGAMSFFKDSSIFIRLVKDDDAYNEAVNEFNYFDQIGLYDYDSAWENLEYNTRIQPHNFLETSVGGHGNFVTPVLYGDENVAREVLVKNYVLAVPETQHNHDGDKCGKEPLDYFKHMEHFHDIALRILLIDDKVGDNRERDQPADMTIESQLEGQTKDNQVCAPLTNNQASECWKKEYVSITELDGSSDKKLEVKSCNKCSGCTNNRTCKLLTIKRLMDDGAANDGKGEVFTEIGQLCKKENYVLKERLKRDYFYWNEQDIDCYYCNTIIKDFIDDSTEQKAIGKFKEINVYSESPNHSKDNNKESLNISCSFEPSDNSKDIGNNVQIVGVRDVRTALILMSKYKFDMVFSDYLLDHKEAESVDQRDYANQLFKFLSREFKSESCNTLLNKLRQKVLDNRGPMGKLWIMPITGFNQAFIQDLYRNKINLIDYRWSISNGADPITTPWQFLYHLNRLIELQLRMCVYKREQLLGFLLITCNDLKELEDRKRENKDLSFENEFKSIMGSDYATFMQLYGNQLPIKRDALIKNTQDTVDDKSVFATYIWNHFYQREEFIDVIEFNRLAHKFYHKASTMYNDSRGRRRLNEAFANLDLFIRTNKRITEIIGNKDNHLSTLIHDKERGLAYMKKLIAIITQDNNH